MRALLTALFLFFAASPAFAVEVHSTCQCMADPLPKRWKNAPAVFTGTVTAIREVTEETQRGNADLPLEVTVAVDEGFKGVAKGTTFIFFTNENVNTCMGAHYRQGAAYLFFAYQRVPEIAERWSLYNFPSGTFDVGGICGGTKRLDDKEAEKEIAEIRTYPPEENLLPAKDGVVGLKPEKEKPRPE